MTARKITRRDMKHDEFVSTVGRITAWAEENLMTLVWGAVGILAAFGVGYGVLQWLEHRQNEGETALARVESAFEAPVGDSAPVGGGEAFASDDEKYRAVLERAALVLEEHGSTRAAEVARYYRGLAYCEMGELEPARQQLSEFIDRNSDHFLAPHARRKVAETYEIEGNLEEACTRYRELTLIRSPEFPPGLAVLDLGRCLVAQGDRTAAAAAYEEFLDEHLESPYASDVRQKLFEIKPD